MNKTEQLERLVQKHDLEGLVLPKLKEEPKDYWILDVIEKIFELFEISEKYELASWVKPTIYWSIVGFIVIYVGYKLYNYLKIDRGDYKKIKVSSSNAIFTSQNSILNKQIDLALQSEDYRKAMKLKWLFKLQQRNLVKGSTLSDVIKNKEHVKDLNQIMFSPESIVSKKDFDKISNYKIRKSYEK